MRKLISYFIIPLFVCSMSIYAKPQNESTTQSMNASGTTSNQTDLEKAALNGNADAQHKLALNYLKKKENKIAFEWFLKAAKQNKIESQYYLGWMYNYGEGVPRDLKEAEKWFKKAANEKHAPSMFLLAIIYQSKDSNLQNYDEALKIYRYLAENNHFSLAQTQLGEMYELGQGVAVDEQMAIKWYTLAAENGDPYAQYLLAGKYLNGKGVKKDDERSFHWYLKSAENGFDKAQSMVAINYYLGIAPIKKDYVAAYMWLTLSWEPRIKKIPAMVELKRDLENVMTSEQMTEAKRRAKEWKPKSDSIYNKRGTSN